MFGFGTQELLIILLIALFIFGGKKLPEIGAGLGKGLKAFKQGLKETEVEDKDAAKPEIEKDSTSTEKGKA
ncbi:Twin-arginine translocation protein TatA [Dissulfuribacter thermophilus]|uniref:Sec-independent protein translocase protein TatA n=1 Tax=Dissulfuribacter thermophilus TaxID=1156395 RepID=A0A1B9F3Z5_9BACT|nr:twin-arginine translocase TatA/TatE family subunit [Dissulfuribacter thermophilus]OCC14573.1 Twin-arginine translocation protein TatA [Dissulfuribacter thermophilus]